MISHLFIVNVRLQLCCLTGTATQDLRPHLNVNVRLQLCCLTGTATLYLETTGGIPLLGWTNVPTKCVFKGAGYPALC